MLIRLWGIFTTHPGRPQSPANSRSLDCVHYLQSNGSAALGMTQFLSVSTIVTVGMRMKLTIGMRVPMRMDEIRAEKQRLVVQDF
jgi:hypothetical protein